MNKRRSRKIAVGNIYIGGDAPIAVQSMCATRTTDIAATLRQIELLRNAGADLIRVAVDSKKDVEALAEISKKLPDVNLVVDLQESYRLAEEVAPYVVKIRYNPGHLFHHHKEVSVKEKVAYLVSVCREHDCALRVGVNFGSLDPNLKAEEVDPMEVALNSAYEHVGYLDEFGFDRFVVSLKSSDPLKVVEIYKRFAESRPEIPLHLGVTEAGLLPDGEIKTRIAFEQLLSLGIGDTVRASLTVEDGEKDQEVLVAKQIIEDVEAGRFRSVPEFLNGGLNVISCPSCSRVENQAFVRLAKEVKEVTAFAKEHDVTIAVMGCRVNGPGETDHADLGLWCGPNFVNLKRGTEKLGAFKYDEVISRLLAELKDILAKKSVKRVSNIS